MKKNILTLALGVALTITTISGCGGMADDKKNGSVSEPGTGSGKERGTDTDDEDVVTLEMFANFTWLGTDSWTGIIPEAVTAATGVSLDVTRATDDRQLGVMIASGELPDIIWTGSEQDRLSDSELCYSYDELIEKYDIDWDPDPERVAVSRHKNADPEDESFYSFLSNYSTVEDWKNAGDNVAPPMPGLYYRKDIWEELGCPSMDTMEGIVSVLTMVKEKYPDMIPLSGGNSAWRFQPFEAYLGGNTSFVYDENGDAVYRDSSKQFYEAAKFVNSLYQKGLFPEENLAITNEEDAKQQFTTGRCFMYEWTARATNIAQLETPLKDNVPDGKVAIAAIPDDATDTMVRANAGWSGVYISRNCKDPEAAIRLMAYLNGPEGRRLVTWGREGYEYTLDEKGMPQFSEEWIEAQKDNDLMNTKYNNNFFMTNTELDETITFFTGGIDQEILDTLLKNKDKIKLMPELALIEPVSSTEVGIIYTKIEEARKAERLKLYTAVDDAAFETAYQNYIEVLNSMGMETLNDYAKEQVKTVLATMK